MPDYARAAAWLAAVTVLVGLLAVVRLAQVVRQTHARASPSNSKKRTAPVRLTVFLGSGGHTGEMLRLLVALDFARYSARVYVVSSGDSLSLSKVHELEEYKQQNTGKSISGSLNSWSVVEIPRARKVHQSFATAPFTTLISLATCLRLFTLPSFSSRNGATDLILLNGPGSCVPIVVAAFLPRLFNLHSPQIIYVESLARVKRLSLSGKLVQPLVDRFLVQWEGMADAGSSGPAAYRKKWWLAEREYKGILV